MTDAPERIWAGNDRRKGYSFVANGPQQPVREQWQIDQGEKCGCKGTDEYCPCQNVSPDHAARARAVEPDALLDWMTYHHLPLELFREEETQMWVVCDTSRGTVIGSGETTTDALAEARLKELT